MKQKWFKYHVLFFIITWIINYVFNFYPMIPSGKILDYSIFFAWENTLLIPHFYLVMFLSGYFLKNIKYFIPFQIILILIACLILSISPYTFYIIQEVPFEFPRVYFTKMFEVTYISISSLAFLFLQKWDESTTQKMQLTESVSDAELTFLRSQMSPHFLLNTLNSIYSMALNKSPEVYPAMSELRNIYSYVQRSQGKVRLKDEIEYLENFIKIQNRRFGQSVEVSACINIDKDYLIEPLLLCSFIENAFKHGVSMKEKSCININLQVIDGNLEYTVVNSDHSKKNKDATSGIGLKNLSRRLELLYAHNYKLLHFVENNNHHSILTIQKI